MAESIWVGKDEHEGVLAQPRKDLAPPPHWRMETIARTPRPHSLTVRGRLAVFIQDGDDCSDVWLLDLDGGGATAAADHRPRAGALLGRRPAAPVARTARRSPTATTGTCGWSPPAGGPPRRLVAGDSAGVDRRRAAGRRRRARGHDAPGRRRRRRPVAAARWPSRTATSMRTATRGRRPSRPTAPRSPTRSRRAPISIAARSAWPRSRAAPCGRSPARRACTTAARHGRPTAPRSRTPPSAAASTRCTSLAPRTGSSRAPAPTTPRSPGTPTERACSPCAGAATASTSWSSTRRRARPRSLPRAARGARRTGRPPGRSWAPTRTTRRRTSCACRRRRGARARAAQPARSALCRAGGDHVLSARWPGDTGFPAPSGERFPEAAGARGRLSPRRPDRREHRRLGRLRAVLRRQGLCLAGAELPRVDRLWPRLRARQPRRVGRRRHPRLPRGGRLPARRSTGSTATAWRSSAPATARTWRCCR